ncbi:hypothetical protein [Metamycoplasma equirhinis]|uniref:hypothetical protein n=2 Tax=Metamycoplasma equirhinis TaxID=92402 RepID=UPI003593DBF4
MIDLKSKTGKSPKKVKDVGRPEKDKSHSVYDNLTKEQMIEIIKIINEVNGNNKLEEIIKKIKKNSNLKRLANTEIMEILQIKRTKFYYLCKKNEDWK